MPAAFTSATRKYPIYFHYPWSEEDYVEVKLPPGYELDHADAPSPVEFAPTGGYNVKIQISSDKRLLYSRKLAFGNNGRLLFPVATYQALKQVFDAIHQADMHAITLKQAAAVTQ
jgi:hypothetical protein